MQFREYQHVEHFGMPEVEFIEQGKCYISPKIDGTNASVWYCNDLFNKKEENNNEQP